jgi:hypothetical protein
VMPPSQKIDPGGAAIYAIEVQPMRTFTETIELALVSLPISLTASLDPQTILLPGYATLTVTDTHTASLYPGTWYSMTVSATGGGYAAKQDIWLLVGGSQLFLPIIRK